MKYEYFDEFTKISLLKFEKGENSIPNERKGGRLMKELGELNIRQKLLLFFLASDDKQIDPIRVMKGMFILGMEASPEWIPKRERYEFIPYNFGPCSFDVYKDLDLLQLLEYIDTEQIIGRSWYYYFVTHNGKSKTLKIKKEFPPKAREFIAKVRKFVDSLSFSNLLKIIYREYPEYSVRSIFQS